MNILHIDCSPRPEAWSRKLSSLIIERLLSRHPKATIVRRDIGLTPIPHPETDYASALSTRVAYAAARSGSALNLSEELIKEIEAADLLVIGTPMNNFTIPSVLKAWLDQIMRMGRTMVSSPTGKVGLLSDRPVLVAVSSGDLFHGDQAKQPDFLTPYLTTAFSVIGLKTIYFFPLQATSRLQEEALLSAMEALEPDIEAAVARHMVVAKAS